MTTSAGLLAVASFFNHSCAPNCSYIFIGSMILVKTQVPVKAGEELTGLLSFSRTMLMEAR